MTRSTRHLRHARAAALAIGMLALAAPAAFANKGYPTGWNIAAQPAPAIYDFVPGSNHLHRTASGAAQTASVPSTGAPMFEFRPGSNHLHRAQ